MTQPRSKLGDRLREMGFVRLPPLWVPLDVFLVMKKTALRYSDQVNAVRREIDAENSGKENSSHG